ncbi:MAG: hypothetical protein INH34_15620 [Phycisphaerales bacterium]|nr:hypothetical protein [Phycisphaerales bacterium]
MAVSLYQSALIAQNNGEFKRAAILQTFAQASPLLAAMPLVSIQGNSFAWTRESNLGSVEFRAVNGSYTEAAGSVEQRSVALKIIGGDLDVDRFLVQTHGPEARSAHETMKATLLAQTIAHQIIKGSTTAIGGATANANGFDGLQARFGAGFGGNAVQDNGENADQIIQNSGGAALSLKSLDEAIQAVDNPTHLLMAKKTKVNMTAFLRNSSSISTSRDEFGRIVTSYAGLPILEADVLGTSAGLQQIGFNENADSSTSIYVLSMSDMGLQMVQNGGIDVRDLGEQDSKPVFRTRVEWYCNLVDIHPRCVARLYDIANDTAIA